MSRVVRKKAQLTLSKKLFDGTLAAVTLGTEIEDTVSSTLTEGDVFNQAFQSMLKDWEQAKKENPIVAMLMNDSEESVEQEALSKKLESKLDEYE